MQRKPVIDLAEKELGLKPQVPLEQGLDYTIDYFKIFSAPKSFCCSLFLFMFL